MASCSIGGLIHVEGTLWGVVWDQASGVAVAPLLVQRRMSAIPDYILGQGVEMTEPGRLFVLYICDQLPRGEMS